MPLRFQRSIKLLPGVHLNLSKTGVSLSLGTKGATVNIGRQGARGTVGLPGTGLSYTQRLGRLGALWASPWGRALLLAGVVGLALWGAYGLGAGWFK